MDFTVEGMHCGACAARVERALGKVPGAASAQVNYATKRARISGDVREEDAVAAVRKVGYELSRVADKVGRSDKDSEKDEAKRRFLLSAALSFPVFVLGMFHIQFPGSLWLELGLTAAVLLGPGLGFFARAAKLLLHRGVNMDTLVALGVGAAFFASLANVARGRHELYFESAVVIVTLVLLGRFLEQRARRGTQEAIRKLQDMRVKTALKLEDGREREVSVEELQVGDLVLVRPGERVALDGEIHSGESTLDESMMTGESRPSRKGKGESVIGATLNTGKGRLVVRVGARAEATFLARIVSLVEDAQASKAEAQRLADRISLYFVPTVLAVAALTILYWRFVLGVPLDEAFHPGIAVLVIACPCALGLATPTAILTGTGRAAEDLILIRSAPGLEQTGSVTAVVVDKTGTLTEGRPRVTTFHPAPGVDEKWALALIAAAESGSQHPLATSVLAYAEERELVRPELEHFQEHAGRGIEATVDGKIVLVGNARLLAEKAGVSVDGWRTLEQDPQGMFFAAIDGKPAAAFKVEDPIRKSSPEALRLLREMGILTVMATGDRPAVADAVGRTLGLTDVRAGLLPEAKIALIQELQGRGLKVAMVGDGINDAPALAQADVGIAVGSGADVATDAADVVIPHGNLAKVVEAIRLSRRTVGVIRQNLVWAFMYNVLAIPLAAMGQLSPMIAAGAMAFSSVSVVGNSLRLKRRKI